MMTGSRNQYIIQKEKGGYVCCAKYNPFEQKWSEHSNSPHDSDPVSVIFSGSLMSLFCRSMLKLTHVRALS
jgi:hypothetical protein